MNMSGSVNMQTQYTQQTISIKGLLSKMEYDPIFHSNPPTEDMYFSA